jgi:hypothetical protein
VISDKDVERALDYLRDSVEPCAQARANRLYMEQWVKTVKAKVQTEQKGMTVAAADAVAACSPAYLDALQAMKEAINEDERCRFLREAANIKIEAWRTQSSNERAGRI